VKHFLHTFLFIYEACRLKTPFDASEACCVLHHGNYFPRIWKNVTSKINALGVAPRSVKEIKDKWRNLTSKAKSAFTEYRREKNMTGGGPAPGKVLCPTAFWVIT
jgi:hypothetical protein